MRTDEKLLEAAEALEAIGIVAAPLNDLRRAVGDTATSNAAYGAHDTTTDPIAAVTRRLLAQAIEKFCDDVLDGYAEEDTVGGVAVKSLDDALTVAKVRDLARAARG